MQNLFKLLASTFGFTSAQGLTSTNVQDAIDEGYLKSAKLAAANTFTDTTESTSTTTGALQVRGGVAVTKNLVVGSSLILPTYSTFRVVKNNTLQTQSTDNVVVSWNTEEFDDDGVFASNTFTANATGKFCFSGAITLINNDASTRTLGGAIRINGTTKSRIAQRSVIASASEICTFHTVLDLTSGNTVDIIARNFGVGTSYSVGNASFGAEANYFSGYRIK